MTPNLKEQFAGVAPPFDKARVVFLEEHAPDQYMKVVVAGEIDETLLEAMEAFIARQRKRNASVAVLMKSAT